MYKTGDLARWTREGVIEYLGRIDHQVKLRGFRIELGEIEAVMRKFVREATVVVIGDNQDRKLVAYYVGEPLGDLKRELASQLPEYMIPSAFVALDAIPLSANGKVDRQGLPKPKPAQKSFVAARDATEEKIAAVWCQVLKLERVGIDDNFFEVGGQSLLMPLLQQGLEKALGRSVAMVRLFQYPTIAAQAAALVEDTSVEASAQQTTQRASDSRSAFKRFKSGPKT